MTYNLEAENQSLDCAKSVTRMEPLKLFYLCGVGYFIVEERIGENGCKKRIEMVCSLFRAIQRAHCCNSFLVQSGPNISSSGRSGAAMAIVVCIVEAELCMSSKTQLTVLKLLLFT